MNRAVKAALLGSVYAAALFVALLFLPVVILDLFSARPPMAFTIQVASGLFASLVAFSIAAALSLGLLWHHFALSLRWTNVFAYMLVGLLMGALLPAVFTAPFWLREIAHPPAEPFGSAFAMIATGAGAAQGLFTALLAWLIRRPDGDPPNPPTSAT